MRDLYVIEARHPDGTLDLSGRQPEALFGARAIHGINSDDMAQVIFRNSPTASLTGDSIPMWPGMIDTRWRARRKTW